MKKLLIVAICILIFASPANAGNWRVIIFGFEPEIITKENWKGVIAGAATNNIVHMGGHYIYAWTNDMSIRQDGFYEIVGAGYSNKEYREFTQAGFITEAIVGLILTSIPSIKDSGFVKGYVMMGMIKSSTYPLLFKNNDGDLNMSDNYGGNKTWEYVGYNVVAAINIYKTDWRKHSE